MEEISDVLKEMPKGKSLRPDGLTVEILQHHWMTIKDDLLATILHFFGNRLMLSPLNHTFLGFDSQKGHPIDIGGLPTNLLPWSCLQNHFEITSKHNIHDIAESHRRFTNDLHQQMENHILHQSHSRVHSHI